MQQQRYDTEDVYGLKVNRHMGMTGIARSILTCHIIFIVTYVMAGICSFAQDLLGAGEVPPGLEDQQTDVVGSPGAFNPLTKIVIDVVGLLVPVLVFFCIRVGIKKDDQGFITGALILDGCCSICNCCIGGCSILGLLGLSALESAVERSYDEICAGECADHLMREPETGRCTDWNYQDSCSTCFDYQKCTDGLVDWQKSLQFQIVTTAITAILVCGEMVCCIFATYYLSQAHENMVSYPFCRCMPSSPQAAWGNAPAAVVVGKPVQATVFQSTKVQPEDNPMMS